MSERASEGVRNARLPISIKMQNGTKPLMIATEAQTGIATINISRRNDGRHTKIGKANSNAKIESVQALISNG